MAAFGTVLGVTDGNVKVYSSDYGSVDRNEYPDDSSLIASHHGVFTGYKWQCVELARRYWLVNFGVVFDSIPMAFDIFNLKTALVVATNRSIPLYHHANGSSCLPNRGSLLIWDAVGEMFSVTGHVAVVVNVSCTFVDVVEQNVLDEVWKQDENYSRRLPVALDPVSNSFTVFCTFEGSRILGWVTHM